jgi:hypothetical protein
MKKTIHRFGYELDMPWCNNEEVPSKIDYPCQLEEDRGGYRLNSFGGCRYWETTEKVNNED